AAGARAGQHDILQIFVEQQLRHLVGLRLGRDAGPHRTLALAAAVEARRIDAVPRIAQPVRHLLPDPAALIGAVHQYVSRHRSVSLRIIPRFILRSSFRGAAMPSLESIFQRPVFMDSGPRPLGDPGMTCWTNGPNLPGQFPPVTSIVTPVTKSASLDARKQITFAWSGASA